MKSKEFPYEIKRLSYNPYTLSDNFEKKFQVNHFVQINHMVLVMRM